MTLPVVQTFLSIAAIVLGLAMSAAWAAFLGLESFRLGSELFRAIWHVLRRGLFDFGSASLK